MPHGFTPLRLTALEARDTPAALPIIAESFDTQRVAYAPAGWQQWASNGQEYYGTIRPPTTTSGTQALAVYGTLRVESRLWNATAAPSDAVVSANVRSDSPAPIVLFARGTSLNTTTGSYVGVAVADGGSVAIVESVNGQVRVLASASPSQKTPQTFLSASLTLVGGQATVTLQRLDTKQFLNASGQWQTATANVLTTTVKQQAAGFAGIGRLSGTYGTAYVDDFAVSNISTDYARKYSHIRLAQLAYSGTPTNASLQQQFSNSVDLVVSHPTLLGQLEDASANTAKTIYTNVSNLYEGLLYDWLANADRKGVSRELPFYHVTQATAFSGSSQSSRPVNNLYGVYRGSVSDAVTTDLTSNATGGRSTGVTFGATGTTVGFGYSDKFRELNVTLTRAAQAGFNGTWEYVSAVDANGNPTAWKTLSVIGDTTNNWRATGQVSFDPPRDWATANQPGTANRFFYVRYRVTAGTAALGPDAKSVFGRDYVNANGRTQGTIPAFDSTADRDGDGYLNDTEWARRRSGFDARFVYESRLFYPQYGQMRFVTNPGSVSVRDWLTDYHRRQLAANPLADGLFIDNAGGRLPFPDTPVIEPTANYTADSAAAVAAVRAATPTGLTIVNTSGGRTEANAITKAGGMAFEEFILRPTSTNWSSFGDTVNTINQRLAADPKASVIVDSHPSSTSMTDPRTQMGVLSSYYLLADAERTYLMFYGGFAPAVDWSQKFTPAAAVNVGKPKAAMTTWAAGQDPQNTVLSYKVLGREYDSALVLYKPLSYALGKGTGTTADATATTHLLNGNYRILNADGTQGAIVRQVTLRNGEGVVLMKA